MSISNRRLILLMVFLLAIAAGMFTALWLTRPVGAQVVVTVDGVEFGRFDLNRDRTVLIGPKDGSWHNTLQIRDGQAAVIESDCENQICVHTPALTEDLIGIIVCLPHGVAVVLE